MWGLMSFRVLEFESFRVGGFWEFGSLGVWRL